MMRGRKGGREREKETRRNLFLYVKWWRRNWKTKGKKAFKQISWEWNTKAPRGKCQHFMRESRKCNTLDQARSPFSPWQWVTPGDAGRDKSPSPACTCDPGVRAGAGWGGRRGWEWCSGSQNKACFLCSFLAPGQGGYDLRGIAPTWGHLLGRPWKSFGMRPLTSRGIFA